MDQTDVFGKTPDGQDEVATRARHLPARLRSLLIMVDGKRSVGEMLAHHPAAAEAQANLAALSDAGLIALVPKPVAPVAPAPAAPPPAPALASHASLDAVKKFVCATLHEALGPDADLFTGKVEAAGNLPDVLAQAEKMREILRGTAGNRRADAYWEKLNSMLA